MEEVTEIRNSAFFESKVIDLERENKSLAYDNAVLSKENDDLRARVKQLATKPPNGHKDIIHANITPMLKNMVIGNRQKDAIMTKEYSNEFNTVTVEKIVVLMEEVAVLESRYEDHNSGNLRTAVNVLRKRVEELKGKIHD